MKVPLPKTAKRLLDALPREVSYFILLALSSAATQLVRLFTGVVNARLLTPTLYATTSSATVAAKYFSYGQAGVQNGLNRQLPIDLGKGETRAADSLVMTAFWAVAGAALVVAAVLVALALLGVDLGDALPSEYLPDVALLAVALLFYAFFVSYLVSYQRFTFLSRTRLIFEVIMPLAGVAMVWLFAAHGLILTMASLMGAQSVVIAWRIGFRPRLEFAPILFFSLLKTGFPILLSSLLGYAFMTIDFLFVASIFPRSSVGLYGFALTGSAFFRAYAQSVSDILSPKIGRAYGASGEHPESLRRFAIDYTFVIVPVMVMLAVPFALGLPVLIRWLLPAYAGSIPAFRFLVIAELALAAYIPCGHVLTVLRKQTQIIALVGAAIGAGCAIFIWVVNPSTSLATVAALWMALSAGLSVGIIALSVRATRAWSGAAVGTLVRAALVLLALVACMLWLPWLSRDGGILWQVGIALLEVCALELLCFVGLLWCGRRVPMVVRLRTRLAHALKP